MLQRRTEAFHARNDRAGGESEFFQAHCRRRAGRDDRHYQEWKACCPRRAATRRPYKRSRMAICLQGSRKEPESKARDRLSPRQDYRARQIRMTRVALDSNLLLYAELEPKSAKGLRAASLILRA